LKNTVPDTCRAIITFEKRSAQILFSPKNALEDFRRKVKELWNIPRKLYYLTINGVHEAACRKARPGDNTIQVKIKGLLGGGKKGTVTIILEGEECRCWTTQTFEEVLKDRGIEIQNEFLMDEEEVPIEIGSKIGDTFKAGSTAHLTWFKEDDENVEGGPISFTLGNIRFNGDLNQTCRQIIEKADRSACAGGS
jgi:hypothetical protein